MTPTSSKRAVLIISIVATVILIATWWINGAKGDDVWFYIVAIAIVFSSGWITSPKKEKDEGH